MGNWHNVLRAISMASCTGFPFPLSPLLRGSILCGRWWLTGALFTAKLAKPEPGDDTPQLPQTLVRIPTEHAPALQAQADAVAEAEAEAEAAEESQHTP